MSSPSIVFDPSDMIKRMGLIDSLVDAQTRIAGESINRRVRSETTPQVPLRRGWLERSYRATYKGYNPLQLDITYSAKSKEGYDYAEIQHEHNFHHPIRGTDHYLLKGFMQSRPVDVWRSHLERVL